MGKDYHELPKLRDSISYVYIEHAIIEQEDLSIVIIRADEHIRIPIAVTTCLLLGPGTSITHAAIKTIADNGCMVVWCGENISRFYAFGNGESYSSKNLLRQAALCMDKELHLEVAKRMYIRRFGDLGYAGNYSLQQLRGMEGIRVREAYKLASKQTGVKWNARSYKQDDWNSADPINKALSQANAILYAVCHAAILSLGYSPSLGFIHTGKQLSFVYDVADLYKADITIPAAFQAVRKGYVDLDKSVRLQVRAGLERAKLLKRIPEDLNWIIKGSDDDSNSKDQVGSLWTETGEADGGRNYADEVLPW